MFLDNSRCRLRAMLPAYRLYEVAIGIWNSGIRISLLNNGCRTRLPKARNRPFSNNVRYGRLTHQVKIYTMIHQVIHPRLHPLRRTEIYPILFTDILDLLPCPRQAHQRGVELGEVGFQHRRCVASRVARYEKGKERRSG